MSVQFIYSIPLQRILEETHFHIFFYQINFFIWQYSSMETKVFNSPFCWCVLCVWFTGIPADIFLRTGRQDLFHSGKKELSGILLWNRTPVSYSICWRNLKIDISLNISFLGHKAQGYTDVLCLVQALLAARNSAGIVFTGTFGALAYVFCSRMVNLDVLCIFNFIIVK